MDSVKVNEPTAVEKIEKMEHELRCSICQDYFVRAFTLNCSHSFCYSCINEWKQNHFKCPLCRCLITGMAPSRALDNMVATLKNDASLSLPIVPIESMDFSSLFGYRSVSPVQNPVESYDASGSQEQPNHYFNINVNSDVSVSSISDIEFNDEADISSASIDDDLCQEFSHSATTQDELTDVEEEEEEMYNLESTDDWAVERVEDDDGDDNEEQYSQQSDIENLNIVMYFGDNSYYDNFELYEADDENYGYEQSLESFSSDDNDIHEDVDTYLNESEIEW